jgi:hypothetical protein
MRWSYCRAMILCGRGSRGRGVHSILNLLWLASNRYELVLLFHASRNTYKWCLELCPRNNAGSTAQRCWCLVWPHIVCVKSGDGRCWLPSFTPCVKTMAALTLLDSPELRTNPRMHMNNWKLRPILPGRQHHFLVGNYPWQDTCLEFCKLRSTLIRAVQLNQALDSFSN